MVLVLGQPRIGHVDPAELTIADFGKSTVVLTEVDQR